MTTTPTTKMRSFKEAKKWANYLKCEMNADRNRWERRRITYFCGTTMSGNPAVFERHRATHRTYCVRIFTYDDATA